VEPIATIAIVGSSILSLVLKVREDRKARAAGEQTVDPLHFTHQQAAFFTSASGTERHFDTELVEKLPGELAYRSAVPVAVPAEVSAIATCYELVPLRDGAQTGAEVLSSARERGQTVLGSLSMVYLVTGDPTRMFMLCGSAELSRFAPLLLEGSGEPGAWAVIPGPPGEPEKSAAAEPPAVPATPPYDTSRFERIPPEPQNGIAQPAAPAAPPPNGAAKEVHG
jgi:hypothetical protein